MGSELCESTRLAVKPTNMNLSQPHPAVFLHSEHYDLSAQTISKNKRATCVPPLHQNDAAITECRHEKCSVKSLSTAWYFSTLLISTRSFLVVDSTWYLVLFKYHLGRGSKQANPVLKGGVKHFRPLIGQRELYLV